LYFPFFSQVRKLIQLMGTLEPVPDDHNILVKLTYTERTPDHYEPPCFVPSTPQEQSLVCPAGCFHNECGKSASERLKILQVRSLDATYGCIGIAMAMQCQLAFMQCQCGWHLC
jgi:hypothetical protein